MKAIIDGLIYDTEKSDILAEYYDKRKSSEKQTFLGGDSKRKLGSFIVQIYRSKNNNYFLFERKIGFFDTINYIRNANEKSEFYPIKEESLIALLEKEKRIDILLQLFPEKFKDA